MDRRPLLRTVASVFLAAAVLQAIMAIVAWTVEPRAVSYLGIAMPRTTPGFLISSFICLDLALLAGFLAGRGPARALDEKDAILIVVVGWATAWLTASLGHAAALSMPWHAAIFEGAATVTMTGASVMEAHAAPLSVVWWRAIHHGIAGFATITLAVALLSHLTHGDQLMSAPSPASGTRRISARLQQTVRAFAPTYLTLLAATTVLLWLALVRHASIGAVAAAREAIFGALGLVSTAGLRGHIGLLQLGDPVVDFIVIAASLAAATSAILHARLWQRDARSVWRDPEWRALVGIWLGATAVGTLTLWLIGQGPLVALRQAALVMAGIVSTSGVHPIGTGAWPDALRILTLMLMLIGGSAGSAAGGIKLARILVLGRVVQREIRKLNHPRAVIPLRVQTRVLKDSRVWLAIALVFSAITTWMVGTIALVATDGSLSLLEAAAAAAATLSNTGTTWNSDGITYRFHDLNAGSHIVLGTLMWAGRLEIMAVLLAATPRSWRT